MTTALEQRLRRLEDLEAIRDLDARYCRLLDEGAWAELVELFTPDGVFDGLRRVQGHAELLPFYAGLAESGLSAFWHHVTNLEIAVEGDRARTTSLLWQPCVVDDVPHVAAGRYTDELLRSGEEWRYRSRRVRFSYWAPLSEGWDRHRFALESARAAAVRP